MVEKRKMFLLNDEQKILVFLNFGGKQYVPKIIIPSFDMPFLATFPLQTLQGMKYIFHTIDKFESLNAINNHLKKVYYNIRLVYYATQFEFTEEIWKNTMIFCNKRNFLPDFMSIQEIEDALIYIKENYENAETQKDLEQSLYFLKRKLNYEEY